MTVVEIEKKVEKLVKKLTPESFIYDLLLAYDPPKATVTLLKGGTRDKSDRKLLETAYSITENTLAHPYAYAKMFEGFKEAHYELDLAVERCYRAKPFTSDEERLEDLFKLYEKMIAEEGK